MRSTLLVTSTLALAAAGRPRFVDRRADFTLQNGKDAISLNDKFKTLTTSSPCQEGENACVDGQFAQCVGGKFIVEGCGAGTVCAALPLVNSPGTSITCTTAQDRDARIAATGATGGSSDSQGTEDPQQSLTLLQSVIATGFESDGQPSEGQAASATSSNNFINFCATVPNLKITNGQQIKEGSCNPAPMGVIASTANMPSCKFVNPKNGATIPPNMTFTVQLAIKNLHTGAFTNPDKSYFAGPQTVDEQGNIIGHSHIVIEALPALDSTAPTDPSAFVYFKGLNDEAKDGILSVDVQGGLPAGTYRIASINSAANHQPALVAVAQRGSLDDMAYFTVA